MSGGQQIFASGLLIDDNSDPEIPVNLSTQQLKANGNPREIYINGQDPLAGGGGGGGDALLAGGTAIAPQTFSGFNLFNNNVRCDSEFVSTDNQDGFRGASAKLSVATDVGAFANPEVKIVGNATSNRPSNIQGNIEFSGELKGGVIGGTNDFLVKCDVPNQAGGFQADVSLTGQLDATKEVNSGTDIRAGVVGGNETIKLEGSTGKITCDGDIELLTSGANITGGATGQIRGGDFVVGVGGQNINRVSIQPNNEDASNDNARIHLGQAVGSFSKLSIVKGKPNAQITAGDTTVQFQQNDTMFPRTLIHPAFFSGGSGVSYNWTNNAYLMNGSANPTIGSGIAQNHTVMTLSATHNGGVYTPNVGSNKFFDLYNDPPTQAGVGNDIFFPFSTRFDDGAGNISTIPQARFRIVLRQVGTSTSLGGFLASTNVISLAGYPAPQMANAVDSGGNVTGSKDSFYPLEYSTGYNLLRPNANGNSSYPRANSVFLNRRTAFNSGTQQAFHQFFIGFEGFTNLPANEQINLEIFVVAVQ